MLRYHCVCHRLNLGLQNAWHHSDTEEFLKELDHFFKSVAQSLEMGKTIQDEIAFYSATVCTSYLPGQKHAWSMANSRFNSRHPLAVNLADNYPSWLLLCQSRRKHGSWAAHLSFLKKPQTYLRVHMIADVLTIAQVGSVSAQGADPLQNGAVQTIDLIERLKCSLHGYAIANPTPSQIQGESGEASVRMNSVLKRAFADQLIDSRKWHVQRGLHRLGFGHGKAFSDLRVRLSDCADDVNAPAMDLGFKNTDFRDSFQWVKKLVINYIGYLDHL